VATASALFLAFVHINYICNESVNKTYQSNAINNADAWYGGSQ